MEAIEADMYIPKHFKLYELFPKDFYQEFKHEGDKMWWLLDDRGLMTLDMLRDRYGKVFMNNWYWGGDKQYRGYRPPDTRIGAEWSQHKFGRGFDSKFADLNAEDIRQDILNDPFDPDFEYITCIEMNVSWLHFDVRNWDKAKNGILKVSP